MRCQDAERNSLPVPCHEERTLPTARRTQYGTQDRGRDRAHPAGVDQAWLLHEGGGAAASTGTLGSETAATEDPEIRLTRTWSRCVLLQSPCARGEIYASATDLLVTVPVGFAARHALRHP